MSDVYSISTEWSLGYCPQKQRHPLCWGRADTWRQKAKAILMMIIVIHPWFFRREVAKEHAHGCPDFGNQSHQYSILGVPTNATGVVILRHTSPVTNKPVDGTTYVASNSVGSATVIYVGTGTSFADTSLTNDTTYYYAIHSYDANNQFSNGVKVFGEPNRGVTTREFLSVPDMAALSTTTMPPTAGDTVESGFGMATPQIIIQTQ